SLYRLAERWIPQGLGEPDDAPARAMISVRASPVPLRRPAERPTLVLGGVAVWVDQDRGVARLRGAAPASGGVLSLGAGRARLQVDATGAPAAAADLYSMLTVSAALLLAALGRALVHAAAVVAPGGRGRSGGRAGRAHAARGDRGGRCAGRAGAADAVAARVSPDSAGSPSTAHPRGRGRSVLPPARARHLSRCGAARGEPRRARLGPHLRRTD